MIGSPSHSRGQALAGRPDSGAWECPGTPLGFGKALDFSYLAEVGRVMGRMAARSRILAAERKGLSRSASKDASRQPIEARPGAAAVSRTSFLASLALCGSGAAVLLALGLVSAAAAATDSPPARPNIILILTDDEDMKVHAFMPKTREWIEQQGAVFDNYFVTYPFCCPSRATTLRGQYSHNHQITGNVLPSGGFRKFRTMGHESSTIATWLNEAGYHTAFFGKYLNGYDPEKHGVPEGWDEWCAGSSMAHPGYDYVLNENGRIVAYGREPSDYLTDVLARKATAVIRSAGGAEASSERQR